MWSIEGVITTIKKKKLSVKENPGLHWFGYFTQRLVQKTQNSHWLLRVFPFLGLAILITLVLILRNSVKKRPIH